MKSFDRTYLVSAVLLAISVAPLGAQDRTSHGSATHGNTTSSVRAGSLGSGGGRMGSPSNATSRGNDHRHLQPRSGGYGYYPYGAPILLPSDSEYDQLKGRGQLDREPVQEPQENRTGATIFEHNGQAAEGNSIEHGFGVAQQSQTPLQSRPEVAGPATVLVFRDGHQQEVENYAITGSRLIVIGERTQKILLSDLDLSATAKANADRGVDFKTPKQS
jgi:hypothetical protein